MRKYSVQIPPVDADASGCPFLTESGENDDARGTPVTSKTSIVKPVEP